MLAGRTYMEHNNPVTSMVYKNICAKYRLEVVRSKCNTPPNVVDIDHAKISWDFRIQADKWVIAK